MTRVVLINMPFADWDRPSLALSQLSALVRREFGTRVRVDVAYLSLDFVHFFGAPAYEAIADDLTHLLTGLGDWLFRQVAFPEQLDNADEFFQRYYTGTQWAEFRRYLLDRRAELREFCTSLVDAYDLASADVVGFTSVFAQTVPSLAMARLVKERNPNVITVMGGANCEVPMGAVLATRAEMIDYVFSGPSLHSFPEFVEHLRTGNVSAARLIPGVLTAGDRHTVGRDRDIDDFFEPDYEGFLEAFLRSRSRLEGRTDTSPVLFFETSRGCWWGQRSHCTFCGLNGLGMGYRSMSPDMAVRHFEWLFTHAPLCRQFICTDNIMPKEYPKEVFPKLSPPEGVSLFYEVKLPLSEQDMKVMKKAGVTEIQPGIEALSTETLKLMGKGTTAFLNLQFLKSCATNGISPVWNLLTGFPGEQEQVYEKYLQEIPNISHLPPPNGAFMVRFDRYSPYFTNREEYGLDLSPMDFYTLVYPWPAEDLANLAYFFTDESYSPYMTNAIEWLNPLNDHIDKWRERWRRHPVVRPMLTTRRTGPGEWWIIDTRGETVEQHKIGATTHRLLTRLNSPAKEHRLADELSLPPDQVAETLTFLREHRMLFTEGERILSLVVPEESTITVTEKQTAEPALIPVTDISGQAPIPATGIS